MTTKPSTASKLGSAGTSLFLFLGKNIFTPALVSIIVTLITLYLTFNYHPDDLKMYYTIGNHTQIGTAEETVNIVFINSGRRAVVVQEIDLVHLSGKAMSFEECDMFNTFTQVQSDNLFSMPYAMLGVHAEKRFELYRPDKMYIGNDIANSTMVRVEEENNQTVQALFHPTPVDPTVPTLVLCVVVRYFDHSGHFFTSICPGWAKEMQATGYATTGAIGKEPVQLLPRIEESQFLNPPQGSSCSLPSTNNNSNQQFRMINRSTVLQSRPSPP